MSAIENHPTALCTYFEDGDVAPTNTSGASRASNTSLQFNRSVRGQTTGFERHRTSYLVSDLHERQGFGIDRLCSARVARMSTVMRRGGSEVG